MPQRFTVYRGGKVKADTAFIATGDELEIEIGNYVELVLTTDESKIGVLLNTDGRVKTGAVEIVKQGVRLSPTSEVRPLYSRVRSETEFDD